jgi:membrane fusion protein (multidrug efflux system)
MSVVVPESFRHLLTRHWIALLVLLALLGWGAYEWLIGSRFETTDNAYVQGDVVQITPRVDGTVVAILAETTDYVRAGQVLVRLDPSDAQVALEQAEAELARTVREARTFYADNAALVAKVMAREADVRKVESDAARLANEAGRASDDLKRRQPLEDSGAVSDEDLHHARSQVTSARGDLAAARAGIAAAQAAVASAREELFSNQAMTDGVDVVRHPNVIAASARLREAWLATRRVALPAPVDGYVAQRTAQLGQRVTVGMSLMTIVPLGDVWVEANFKEVQLGNLRIGQPVELRADMYGSSVHYKGHVAGLGAGTGATFALLPAQNATGNWVKVVQRVPVRIALDAEADELAKHPLMIGLSMDVSVDTSSRDGKPLSDAPRADAVVETRVFETLPDPECEAEILRIINANLGAAAPATVPDRAATGQ